MTRSMKSKIVTAVLAIGTLAAAAAANATTAVHLSIGAPAVASYETQPVYAAPVRTVRVPAQVMYDGQPSYPRDWRYAQARGWREHERYSQTSCRAPAWDPEARYMPGQTVWSNGHLFVATPLSASVWNVNSPPEWTPNYWAPARCR